MKNKWSRGIHSDRGVTAKEKAKVTNREYGRSCFQWAVSSLREGAEMRSSQMWLRGVRGGGNSRCKGTEAGTSWAERWPAVWWELSERGRERSVR